MVRPERRNIGFLLDDGNDVVAAPDGVGIVRIKDELSAEYPQFWLFQALRQEEARIQLWTESGGTSYGKLKEADIANVFLKIPSKKRIKEISENVARWAASVEDTYSAWLRIGDDRDRTPIVNSPMFGLEPIEEPWVDN